MQNRIKEDHPPPRQTIILTDPNYAWLQARVDSGEFRTQTEAVNDALRRASEMEAPALSAKKEHE